MGFTPSTVPGNERSVPVAVPSRIDMAELGRHIVRVFEVNAEHRRVSGIDDKLLASLRARKSEYSPAERAKIEEIGLSPDIYTPITDTKCRAAMAQIGEIFSSPGDKPWVLNATPIPEVPESVAKEAFVGILAGFMEVCELTGMIPSPEQVYAYAEARMDEVYRKQVEWATIRAERMEHKVHDQMTEGGWIDAFSAYCNYLCTYGTAVIRGPVPRVVLQPEMKETQVGTLKYSVAPKEVLCYEAVNPWDCYPSRGARKIGDGNICIRVRFMPDELWQFSQSVKKGKQDHGEWFVDTIDALLTKYPNGGVMIRGQPYDILRNALENDGVDITQKCDFEGIEFFGNVRGSVLLAMGVEKTQENDLIEDSRYYEVNAIEVDGHVVYCRIVNPCVGRPLSKGVFYDSVDSWWGDCIADKLKAVQKVTNSSLRNLVVNSAMTAGPQVWVKDVSRLADKSAGAMKQVPWKVWQFNLGQTGQTDVPIGILDLPSRIDELLRVFQWAKVQADEDSGIPAYTYGTNVSGGAGRTASGLAMLTEAANRGMKTVINATDRDVVRDIVGRTVRYNLVFGEDVSIKGDVEVNPSGVMGKILREQEIQKLGQLVNLLTNPVISQVTGPKALVAVLRQMFKANGVMNIDDILPSKEKIEELELIQEIKQLSEAVEAQQNGMGAIEGGGEQMEEAPPPGQGGTRQAQVAQRDIQQNPQAVAARGDPSMRSAPESQVAERRGAA